MAELTAQLNIDTAQFTQGVTKAIQESKTLSDQLTKLSKSGGLDEAAKGTKVLDSSLDKATLSAKALTNQLDKVGREAQSAGSKAKAGLGSFGDALTGGLVGGGVAVLGSQLASLVTTGFNAVIEKGGQFEQTLSAVGAIVGQSGKPLDELGEKARLLAVKFGTDATDQLGAFQTILSKVGPQVAESAPALQKFTDAANTLGKAGGIDAATATNNLVDAMLQLGLVTGDANKDAENAVFLTNQLAKSAQVGAAEIPQVSAALLKVGAASTTLKQSTDGTIAALQALATKGFQGSEAGIAYRNVLNLMVKTSGEGAKAFARLGTSTEELGKLLTDNGSPTEALKKLRTGLQGVSEDSEKAALLSTIFGAENSAAASALIGQIDKIEEFQAGIKDAQKGTGSAFEQAKQQMETFQQVAKTAQATLGDIAISAFQEFQAVLGSVFSGDSIDFTAIAEGAKTAISFIGEILKPLLSFGMVLSNIFLTPVKIVISIFNSLREEIGNIFEGSKESTVSFGDAFQSVFQAVGSIFDSSLAIIKSGISILITIFGSAIEPLIKPFLSVGDESQTLAEKIKAFADGVNKRFQEVANYFTNLAITVKGWRDQLVTVFSELYKTIFNIFFAIGTAVNGVASVFVSVFNSIKSGIASVLSPLNDLIKKIQSWTGATDETKVATQQNNKVAAQSPSIFQRIGQAVQAAGGILGFFRATLAGVGAFFESFAITVNDGFALISSGNVVDGFKKLTNVFSDATEGFAKGYKDAVTKNEIEARKQTEVVQEELKKQQEAQKDANNNNNKDNNRKGNAKKEETALQKALKKYKEYTDNLVKVDSEYDNQVRAIKNDRDLSEEERQRRLTAIEVKANVGRQKKFAEIFGDGVKVPFNLGKDETLKEVESLQNDIRKTEKDLDEKSKNERFERQKKFFERLTKADLEAQKTSIDEASKLAGLTVGQELTTNLIELLGLEGVKVGDKLTEADFEAIQNKARTSLENALADVKFALSQNPSPEEAKSLNETRLRVQDELDKIRIKPKVEPKSLSDSLTDGLASILKDLPNIKINLDNSEALEKTKELNKSFVDLEKSLAKGEITGEEYQRRLSELKQQQDEVSQSNSFFGETLKATASKLAEIGTIGQESLNQQLKDFQASETGAISWSNVMGAAATIAGGAFLKYQAEGQSALKAVVLSALDALQALVPIITAQIFGLYTSSANPANSLTFGAVGAAAAATVTTILLGLVRKAVSGFESGGLVKGGEQLIRINERGQEFVNNASSTRKNMDVLKALNDGNEKRAFELLAMKHGGMNAVSVEGGRVASIAELRAIKDELHLLRGERVLSTTKVKLSDARLNLRGRDLEAVIKASNGFKNKVR